MLYTVHAEEATFTITDQTLGSMIHDYGQKMVQKQLVAVRFSSTKDLTFNSVTLRRMVKRYSAQFLGDVELELREYFARRGGSSFNSEYADLLYFESVNGPTLSSSVSAGIGEGMAGYLVQKLHQYTPKARPIGYTPDIIMERLHPPGIALVEAKGTTITSTSAKRSVLPELRLAAIDMIKMLAMAPYLNRAKYTGYVIGTEIVDEDEFRCYVLRLEQP